LAAAAAVMRRRLPRHIDSPLLAIYTHGAVDISNWTSPSDVTHTHVIVELTRDLFSVVAATDWLAIDQFMAELNFRQTIFGEATRSGGETEHAADCYSSLPPFVASSETCQHETDAEYIFSYTVTGQI
jgi:hypothetical protein